MLKRQLLIGEVFTIGFWCCPEDSDKTPPHRLLGSKTTPLRDLLDGLACMAQQLSRRFNPKALYGASWRQSSAVTIVPNEASFTHSSLSRQN